MTTTEAPPFDPATLGEPGRADVPPAPSAVGPSTVPAAESAAEPPPRRPGMFGRPPPRATPPRADKRPAKAPKEPKSSATLKRHVAELYAAAGMMVLPFDQQCGTVVVNSADQCADSLVKLSEENETVRKLLEGMVQTSAIGAVIVAHMPIIMAVSAHHIAPDRSLLSDPGVSPFPDNTPPADETVNEGPTVTRDTQPRAPRRGPARVRPTK